MMKPDRAPQNPSYASHPSRFYFGDNLDILLEHIVEGLMDGRERL